MPAGEALEDDYIVSLLKKDADEHKKRYSTVGNGPLLTSKRRPEAPKPNTRFLKNILRDTDNHNAALKAKEEEESRARLRDLRNEDRRGKRKMEEAGDGRAGKRVRENRPGRWASALGLDNGGKRGAKGDARDGKRKPHDDYDEKIEAPSARERTHRRRQNEDDQRSERRHRSSRHGQRSHSMERKRSPSHRKEHRRRPSSPTARQSSDRDDCLDSDPLQEFLGPQPPPHPLPRGRGAFKPSDIDSRFQSNYDPSTDVALNHDEEGEDDWDMALEALKARTKWRAQGADRLRAAGFTEEEVGRWEKRGDGGGGERDAEDVRWRKTGEGREWDRGKVVDGNGVGLKAEWAR